MNHAFHNKHIWVTGASSGIGRALAIHLADQGARVIVSARRKEILDELCQEHENIVLAIPLDVTSRAENQQAADIIAREMGHLDMAIFNAGGSDKSVLGFDPDLFEFCMKLNFHSMVYGIAAVKPLLEKSREAHIVGVCSVAALNGVPRFQAYSAAKAAARNMLNGLAIDWCGQIDVTIVNPGFVKTPLTDQNTFKMPFIMSPERAASIIARGIAKKQLEVTFPAPMRWIIALLNHLPKKWRIRYLHHYEKKLD